MTNDVFFNKSNNKWWDGYEYQPVVVINNL